MEKSDSECFEEDNISISDNECVIVPNMGNVGHTCESSASESSQENLSRKKLVKKLPKKEEDPFADFGSDSSVEIIDVKLPYEKLVKEKKEKETQDLDDEEMWERLIEREQDKESELAYEAE